MEQGKIVLDRLDRFSFQEAVTLWNEGFTGYFTDMTRTLTQYIENLAAHRVYPEHSVVAVVDGKPAGFILTALRSCAGRKTAWNAGTGVVPSFRGTGIGKAMMAEVIRLYHELGVQHAYLEAISENRRAIALYSGYGYREQEHLVYYIRKGTSARPKESGETAGKYRLVRALPKEVGELPFYRANVAWCSQWANIQGGEAQLVLDDSGAVAGYALLKRSFTDDGSPAGVKLLQGEADAERADGLEVARFMIQELYAVESTDFTGIAENIPATNNIFNHALREAGFRTVIEQKMMVLDL